MAFDKNVFVNCPFDEDYLALLRPLLFTITYLGLKPRIALEELESGVPRIQKIVRLIASSRYAIHDLSRLKAREAGEYYRLNMPFELGIDVGCRLFGSGQRSRKRCLILESERYRYQAAVSDISGSDIAVHGGSPEAVVSEVRNWLNGEAGLQAPGPSGVCERRDRRSESATATIRIHGSSGWATIRSGAADTTVLAGSILPFLGEFRHPAFPLDLTPSSQVPAKR